MPIEPLQTMQLPISSLGKKFVSIISIFLFIFPPPPHLSHSLSLAAIYMGCCGKRSLLSLHLYFNSFNENKWGYAGDIDITFFSISMYPLPTNLDSGLENVNDTTLQLNYFILFIIISYATEIYLSITYIPLEIRINSFPIQRSDKIMQVT